MKALKILGNIIGVVIALVLSLVLLVMLIVTPVVTSLGLITKPETVSTVITQPEVIDMLVELPGVEENLEEVGLNKEFVHEVAQSQFFEDLVHLYTENTVDGVTGVTTEQVTVGQVQQVIENNKEEVIDLVRPMVVANSETDEIPTDEEVEEIIDYAVENYGQNFLDSLPSGQDLLDLLASYSGDISGIVDGYDISGGGPIGAPAKMSVGGLDLPSVGDVDLDEIYSLLIRYVLDGTMEKALITAIVFLSALILLFRWPRFKGLMWLCVVFALGGGAMYGVSTLLTYRPFEEELAHFFHIAVVIFDLIAVHIRNYAVAFLIVAGVCLVLFIIARIILKLIKRAKKKGAKPVAAAVGVSQDVIDAAAAVAVPEPFVEATAKEEEPEAEETDEAEETEQAEEIEESEEVEEVEQTEPVEKFEAETAEAEDKTPVTE